MDSKQIQELIQLFRILIGQFQKHNELTAEINNLPAPKPLPENWDELVAKANEEVDDS